MRVQVLFLAVTLGLVAGVADTEWWKTALIYQIYPRSFKDSNGDGIGDLNGITSKLPYLKDTGVDAIWLSPIYLSPMYDFGYDITDYRQIATEYGTMEDFENLMEEAKNIGVRVLLDFVPNHTGNESEWFQKSIAKEEGYENYYVWADGVPDPENPDSLLPPNNWVSIFRYSAWEYKQERGQYYLHQFLVGQPDLNYRDPKVQQEMKDVLRFWLDKGVSGFRVDAVNIMYEVDPQLFEGHFPDEPLSGSTSDSNDYDYLNHIYTKNQDETYNVVYDWRDVLNEYIQDNGEYKIMITEAYADLDQMIRYYGNGKRNGSIPFNFSFLSDTTKDSNAKDIKIIIDKWMTYMPSGMTANWVNGNHDQPRLATRLGTDRVDIMNMLALLLPGVAVTYQGEELGMTDGEVSWEETKDPQACNTHDPVNYWKKSRDPCRTPYHWDDSLNAGFSSSEDGTWLPVASNYHDVNLAAQVEAEKSHYKFYKDVTAIRKEPAVRSGDLETRALSSSVLAVARLLPGVPGVVGVVNLSDEEQHVDLSSIRLLPSNLQVLASGIDCTLEKGDKVNKRDFILSPHCAVAFRSVNRVPDIDVRN